MSLLRLTAKIDADASGFHSKVKGVESASARMNKAMTAQLRAGLTYFIGFSGITRMIRGMADFASRIDELRPKMEALGIVIDDALIEKAKQASAQWEAAIMSIKAGLLPAFAELLNKSSEVLVTWKYMFTQAKEFGTLSRIPGMLMDPSGSMKRGRANYEAYKGDLAMLRAARQLDESTTKPSGSRAMKSISEAAPKMAAEALSKIGGFTGRAQEELKSIQWKQLRTLEKIDDNTKTLKGGVG
jgi:hypothetical protein